MRWLVLGLSLAGCGGPPEPRVAAAASLAGVLREILADSGARASFAASSTLARQIAKGLDADLYVSADRDWVGWLQDRGYGGAPRPLAGNVLVAWVRAGEAAPRTRADLRDAGWGRIAVGGPAVPVGRYARAVLAGLGLEERLLPCPDAPSVLRALRAGGAGVALCYATDGAGDPSVRIAFRFDGPADPRVVYWALPCGPAAGDLLARLTDGPARAVWRRHGFLPVE